MIHVAPDATSNQGGRHVFHSLEGLAPYVYTESSSLWDCGSSEADLPRMAEFPVFWAEKYAPTATSFV